MIKNISLSLLALLILVGCGENIESTNDYESIETHNQGDRCLRCHTQFTSAATIYTSLHGTSSDTFASNYTVRLVVANTQVDYTQAKGTGNSKTSYSSWPTNIYTAKVIDKNGNIVNSSVTNSHNLGRLDCNSCHTATGNNGAPGRITSFNYATQNTDINIQTTVSFASNVMPILESKCKSCHGSSGNFTITDAASTYTNIANNNFVNTSSIDSSLLLSKGSGSSHGGGTIISTSSTEYLSLKEWITQGALNN